MNKMRKILYSLLVALCPLLAFGQIDGETPKPQAGTFFLTNAKIVTVTKGTIAKGSVLIQDGKIADVGANLTAPSGAQVIDLNGLSIYPGLIDSGTSLGLVEVGSVPETNDNVEIGTVSPQMQALTAVNPNSVAIPVTRVSGVTTVIANPAGGLFPGTAALINLVGYTPDQMYAGFKGIVMNFPSSARRSNFDRRTDAQIKEAADKAMKNINDLMDKAKLYADIDAATDVRYYPEMAALAEVVKGNTTLLIEVNAAADILEAIKWVQERKVKAIFTGVLEGWRVADKIAAAGIPVVTGPILGMPTRGSDRYDKAYANPGLMAKAGVKVAIRTSDTENVRNLPFNAGFAAAYGMGKEEALKAVTINPAEIFGVADKLGSIEKGKSATLLVADGDPFETKTNIMHVFIDGYKIPMTNRQVRLYQEFLKRDPGLVK